MKRHLLLKSLFLSLLLWSCQSCVTDSPGVSKIKIGDKLPQFSVVLSDGTSVTRDVLAGKIGVIVFFNTGCPDCRQELPVIQALSDRYSGDEEVVIVPIAREEKENEIQSYWEANGLTMPFSAQEGRDVYSLFATSVIPRIYISNPELKVTFMAGDKDMPTLEQLIDAVESARQSGDN